MLGAIIAVIIPHLIHATQLLADPWMQESWQFEAACSAVVVEHWFILDAPAQAQAQPRIKAQVKAGVKAGVKATRSPHARPLPAFLVRRHTLTRDEVLYSMDLMMSAAHPQVIAEFNRELRAEAEVSQLRTALEHAIHCARMGYSSTQMKKLAVLVWRLPSIPIECAEEILAARPHWRNPRGVQARLETALAYL
jgi:hypothetical protein